MDRLIRQAQAEQTSQVIALHRERSTIMALGDGDPDLSVAGDVSMARIWTTPTGHTYRSNPPPLLDHLRQ